MRTVQLRRIARFSYGDALAEAIRRDGPIPVVSSGGVTGSHDVPNVIGPAIVVGRKGSYGSVHWVDSDCFVIDTAYAAFPASHDVDQRWLYYLLSTANLRSLSQDVGVPGLSREAAYALPVPSPPRIEEQRRIAHFLDAETARIDMLLSARRRQKELLNNRFSQLVDGVTIGDVSALSELDIATGPGGWKSSKMYRVCHVIPGFAFASQKYVSRDLGTRLLRGVNVGVDRIDWSDSVAWDEDAEPVSGIFRLRLGDLVIGMDRPWIKGGTRVALVGSEDLPALLLQRVACLRPKGDVEMAFIKLILRSSHFRYAIESELTGVSVPHLSADQIGGFQIRLPDVDVQRSISRAIAAQRNCLNELDMLLDRQADLLTKRRQALITAAVTGQFDVTTGKGADFS